jgi:hypothetical protein
MKNNIIDKTILKFSLYKTVKSKFTWIWFSILFIAACASTLVFKNLQWPYGLVLFAVISFLGFSIFNIVNLNELFSTDSEMGIMGLELRKGKSRASIFWSRYLANKIFSLSFDIVIFLILLIATGVINSREIGNWPLLIFLVMPLD